MQFFASLEKWIGARNPVRIGSSCAAVTGYDFPLGQSPKLSGVKAGRRCGVAQASQARSQNICPIHLIRVVGAAVSAARRLDTNAAAKSHPRKTSSQKEE